MPPTTNAKTPAISIGEDVSGWIDTASDLLCWTMLSHDISYLLDVLDIGNGETEDQLDERLRSQAKELGVDVVEQEEEPQTGLDIDKPFKAYVPEYPRRSDSIDSGTSHSTGLTSYFSDVSKDQWSGHRRRSRASLSFRDYDAFVSRGVPNGRHSLSFSPLTTPSHSTFSLPLSQPTSPTASPKKSFRRIRGLSMLRLHGRTGSDVGLSTGCPHCPLDKIQQRRAVHRLPCGHQLCTQALRNTVKAATDGKTGAVPSCCGKPIPGSLVENVMTQDEQTALLEKLEQWDEAISIAPSMDSSRRDSISIVSHQRPTPRSRAVSEDSRISNLAPKEHKELDKILEREDYRLLLTDQNAQRDRFLRWSVSQVSTLEAEHERIRDETRRAHETAAEELSENHNLAMADAEDKQVKAESDLRETQDQERRDNATALKHMEYYCSGIYSTGDPHARHITPQDLAELDKARRHRDQMPTKHASQINVLRGEQSRRMRLRAQRQHRELHDLQRQQRQQELELERACTRQRLRLDDNVASKHRKVRWRWELQMAVFAKKVEAETGVRVACRLPTAAWAARESSASVPVSASAPREEKEGISTGFALRGQEFGGQFKIGAC